METYNPDQAVPLVGVAANTIRGWCKLYADELSPGANPPSGNERRLTQEDVAKLQRVKGWRDSRLPPQEITRLLQAAATTNEQTHIVIEATPTAQEGQGEALGLQIILSSHQSQLDEMRQEIATVKAKVSTGANQLVTGIVIGAAIVLVLVAILLNGVY